MARVVALGLSLSSPPSESTCQSLLRKMVAVRLWVWLLASGTGFPICMPKSLPVISDRIFFCPFSFAFRAARVTTESRRLQRYRMPLQSLQKEKLKWMKLTRNVSDLPLARVGLGDLLKEERASLTPQEVVNDAEAMVGDVLQEDHGQLDHVLPHHGLPLHLRLSQGQGFAFQDLVHFQDFLASASHLNVVGGVLGEPFADNRSLVWTLLNF